MRRWGCSLYWLFSLLVGPQVPFRPPSHGAIFFSFTWNMLARPSAVSLVSFSLSEPHGWS